MTSILDFDIDVGLPTLLEEEDIVTLAEILNSLEDRLTEIELWAMCKECCLSLKKMRMSRLFRALVITPTALCIASSGNVCFLDIEEDFPDGLYIAPEREIDDISESTTYKTHLYSLGVTLLTAARTNLLFDNHYSQEMRTIVMQMTQESPERRIDINIVLHLCEQKLRGMDSQDICGNLTVIVKIEIDDSFGYYSCEDDDGYYWEDQFNNSVSNKQPNKQLKRSDCWKSIELDRIGDIEGEGEGEGDDDSDDIDLRQSLVFARSKELENDSLSDRSSDSDDDDTDSEELKSSDVKSESPPTSQRVVDKSEESDSNDITVDGEQYSPRQQPKQSSLLSTEDVNLKEPTWPVRKGIVMGVNKLIKSSDVSRVEGGELTTRTHNVIENNSNSEQCTSLNNEVSRAKVTNRVLGTTSEEMHLRGEIKSPRADKKSASEVEKPNLLIEKDDDYKSVPCIVTEEQKYLCEIVDKTSMKSANSPNTEFLIIPPKKSSANITAPIIIKKRGCRIPELLYASIVPRRSVSQSAVDQSREYSPDNNEISSQPPHKLAKNGIATRRKAQLNMTLSSNVNETIHEPDVSSPIESIEISLKSSGDKSDIKLSPPVYPTLQKQKQHAILEKSKSVQNDARASKSISKFNFNLSKPEDKSVKYKSSHRLQLQSSSINPDSDMRRDSDNTSAHKYKDSNTKEVTRAEIHRPAYKIVNRPSKSDDRRYSAENIATAVNRTLAKLHEAQCSNNRSSPVIVKEDNKSVEIYILPQTHSPRDDLHGGRGIRTSYPLDVSPSRRDGVRRTLSPPVLGLRGSSKNLRVLSELHFSKSNTQCNPTHKEFSHSCFSDEPFPIPMTHRYAPRFPMDPFISGSFLTNSSGNVHPMELEVRSTRTISR